MRRITQLLAFAAALTLPPIAAHAQQGGFFSELIYGGFKVTKVSSTTVEFNVAYASPDCYTPLTFEFKFTAPDGSLQEMNIEPISGDNTWTSAGASYKSSPPNYHTISVSGSGCGSFNFQWDRATTLSGLSPSLPAETPFNQTPISAIVTVDSIDTGGYSDPSAFSKSISNLLMLDKYDRYYKYQTVGRGEPIDYINDMSATVESNRPANIFIDTEDNNVFYSPLAVQATYNDTGWEDENANRPIRAVGGYFVSLANYLTGSEKTRINDDGLFEGFSAKYLTTLSSIGILTEGGTYFDSYRVYGSISRGVAAFESTSNNYVNTVTGFEGVGLLGKAPEKLDSGEFDTTKVKFDNRKVSDIEKYNSTFSALGIHAVAGDPIIDLGEQPITSANVEYQTVFGDPYSSPNYTFPDPVSPYRRAGGYLHRVIANENIVGSAENNSYISVDEAAGAIVQLGLDENEGTANIDLRSPALPRLFLEYMGVESPAIWLYYGVDDRDVRNDAMFNIYNTLLIWSQLTEGDSSKGRGGSVREAAFIRDPDDSTARNVYVIADTGDIEFPYQTYPFPASTTPSFYDYFPPEQKATILAQDSVIVGDGEADNKAIAMDGVLVNTMHLSPRLSAPLIDTDLPAADHAGLMYYDLGRNRLQLSVAAPSDTNPKAIAWVNLLLESETGIETTYSNLRKLSHPTITATTETSPSRIILTITGLYEYSSGDADLPTSLYWRRLPYGFEGRGETLWEKETVPNGTDITISNSGDVTTITIGGTYLNPATSGSMLGEASDLDNAIAVEGQMLEFMIFSSENDQAKRAIGTSISIISGLL